MELRTSGLTTLITQLAGLACEENGRRDYRSRERQPQGLYPDNHPAHARTKNVIAPETLDGEISPETVQSAILQALARPFRGGPEKNLLVA